MNIDVHVCHTLSPFFPVFQHVRASVTVSLPLTQFLKSFLKAQRSDAAMWDCFADLSLNPKKVYEYNYEGQVKFGLGAPNLAESGVRMTCTLNVSGVSGDTFSLQVS